jgi:hypothetical protein
MPPFQQPPPPPPPYNRPPAWGQQQGWNQPGSYNQPPGWGDPNQQQYMYNNPNAQPKGSSSTAFLIILIVLLVGVGGVIFAINNTSLFTSGTPSSPPAVSTSPLNTTPIATTTPPATTPATTTTAPQSSAVTVAALMSAYNSNASGAAATYEGKTLDITGTVYQFSADSGYIIFGDSGVGSIKIKCTFTNALSGVTEGQTVTVHGTVGSYDQEETQFLYISNCSLK